MIKENKKVKNATPNEYEGIKFRSKLEVFTYMEFIKNGISLDYEPVSFELIPSFLFNGKKIRPMTYTPDFIHKDFIIECKGFGNDVWPVKRSYLNGSSVGQMQDLNSMWSKTKKKSESS